MPSLEHAGISDQGPCRGNNEDFIAHREPSNDEESAGHGWVFTVADGVGGSDLGEVASRDGSQALISNYCSSNRPPARALRDAYSAANMVVYDLGATMVKQRKPQTTLSCLVLCANQMYVGHIGDSRIYRVRDGEISQLTRDHSEVGELMRMQLLSAAEARHHPRRSVITRTVGYELITQADVINEPYQEGDIFVLCTDGLWEPVEDEDILQAVTQNPVAEACRMLVDLAIRNETQDNLSIQVVKVLKCEEPENPYNPGERKLLRWFRGLRGK